MSAVDPTTDPSTAAPGHRSRREVLCGLAVALLAPGAVVAACGDSGSGSGSGSTNGGATTGGSTGGGSTGGGTPGGQGLAALTDVPDGGGLILDNPDGGKLLVTRNGKEVKAFNASCTHMGTTVNPPEGGVATCTNHGSRFDAATGEVKNGPATKPLRSVSVKVDGGQIVLA